MCEPGRYGRPSVCGDAARKHLFPLPFGVTKDGESTLVFEETIRAQVAQKLVELASLGQCGAEIEDLNLHV